MSTTPRHGGIGAGGVQQVLKEYWKDDFAPLRDAGNAVNEALREDELAHDADLYRRIAGAGPGSHAYFPAEPLGPDSSALSPTTPTVQPPSLPVPPLTSLKHIKSVPLPSVIVEKRQSARSHCLMGLLASASLAWMSVDNQLFLWSCDRQQTTSSTFCSFTVQSGQCIVSVGVVPPKKGVFASFVEWCLVVTTPDEVLLFALLATDGSDSSSLQPGRSMSHGDRHLQLVVTDVSIPTDNVRMLTVTGMANGRIFLGGDDGCLYEMTYEGDVPHLNRSLDAQLEQFYDEGKNIPDVITVDRNNQVADQRSELVILGKRAWRNLTEATTGLTWGLDDSENGRPRKCRKLNRTDHVAPAIKAVLPDFLVNGTLFLLGQRKSTGGGAIVQMAVDEARKTLYTLSSKGWICAFDLRSRSVQKEEVTLAAVVDTPKTARLYLEAVSRGQMSPPRVSSASRALGNITFPGGGTSAQAGVGGMDGARAILKLDKVPSRTGTAGGVSGSDILKPVSIRLVAPTESSRLTLVAVTAGGLRFYLSSLTPNVISSGPTAARTGSSYTIRNPLAPSNRLTLCHVRSPPPSDLGRLTESWAMDSGVEGGISPRIIPTTAGSSAARDKLPQTDASVYDQGIFVSAIRDNISSSSRQNGLRAPVQPVGDKIVATCPDSAARKKIDNAAISTEQTNGSKKKEELTVPGGITETISLPMQQAYGSSSKETLAILPGGIVWDMAVVAPKESNVMALTASSQTPTDNELGVGLPPAYFPPSKIRARDSPSLTKPSVIDDVNLKQNGGTSDAVASQSSNMSSAAMMLLRNLLASIFLPRPVRQGIAFGKSMEAESDLFEQFDSYRISKRDCSKGFSTTAGEASSRAVSRVGSPPRTSPEAKTTRSSKSARLRAWLLRPATVPLNQLSTQHYLQPKEIIAVNAGGLHYFGFTSILSNLAECLVAARDNVKNDSRITSFFKSYGYKEGCCMCLALAIGFGPASGNSNFSAQVRTRASAAALARAYVPTLMPHSERNGVAVVSDNSAADPLVPQGYDFRTSAIYEGLITLFGRMNRPVWHKPVVVVTEGRTVRHQWSSVSKQTPAKVEILLDEATLEEIGGPLRNLQELMISTFSRAVKAVPGVKQVRDRMDVDDENEQYVTSALQYGSHTLLQNGQPATQLTTFEAENLAHLIEERNIHSLYRLLARVVQLVNLLSLLQRTHRVGELREIDWGLLHGLTLAQLAQTPEGQERLESLLNALVTASALDRSGFDITSTQADQLADLFSSQCYLFFSPGSRYAYFGFRKANEALSQPKYSSGWTSLGNLAAQDLRQAAEHWHCASLVTGRVLHTKGRENSHEIALRAMQYGSPLAQAAELLIQLEDVASVVEICLTTAANFKGKDGPISKPFGVQRNYELSWEPELYHKRRDTRPSSTLTSPSQAVAFGTEVTSSDAIDTCYALIFYHLSLLLKARSDLADRMVSVCAASTDQSFLQSFFSHLLESDNADTVLRIDSPALEKWLRSRNEPDLLWRYYNVQGRHAEAGQVAWNRALDTSLKLPLSERIDCLSRSHNSFEIALQGGPYGSFEAMSNGELAQKENEVKDLLIVARIQNSILQYVEGMKPNFPDEVTPELYERLATTLIGISDLYNDYAAAMCRFDECLLILHACRHSDIHAIHTLWKNVFCEELLPCATRNTAVYHFLRNFAGEVGSEDEVMLLSEDMASGSYQVFEDGGWVKQLERRVVVLGKELYGTGADYVFPLDYILLNLEALQQALGTLSPGWALVVLADAGVPFLTILDAYEGLLLKDEQIHLGGTDSSKRIDQIGASLELLGYWVSAAQSSSVAGGQLNLARQELTREMASGRLTRKLDGIKAKLEALPTASVLLDQLREIEQSIQLL